MILVIVISDSGRTGRGASSRAPYPQHPHPSDAAKTPRRDGVARDIPESASSLPMSYIIHQIHTIQRNLAHYVSGLSAQSPTCSLLSLTACSAPTTAAHQVLLLSVLSTVCLTKLGVFSHVRHHVFQPYKNDMHDKKYDPYGPFPMMIHLMHNSAQSRVASVS